MPLRPGAAAFTPKTTLKASAKPWVPPGFMGGKKPKPADAKKQEERKRAEQKRQQEAQEAKRMQEQKRIEEEARRKQEEERQRKEEEERQKKEEEERKKKEEEERKKKDEEERRKQEEEETKQREEEEERKRREEEKKKAEAEAERTKSPAKYDKAFLLSFEKRFTDTPVGLPSVGAYLRKGFRPRGGKGRDFNRRDRDRRQDSGRGGHRGGRNDRRPHGQGRDRRNGKRRGPKQDAPMDIEIKELEKTENRYVIKKDVAADEKLMRSVNSILNKLTPEKFQKLTEQFISLNIDSPSRLRDVVSAIFEKALSEANFCPTYAAFCQVLNKRLPQFDEKKTTFKRELLTQCQKEFEKEGVYDEQELEKLTSQEDKDLYVLKAKQRRLGTIRFIGELYLHNLIVKKIVYHCYGILLSDNKNPDEENLQALCKLLITVGKMITQSERGQPNPPTKHYLAKMKSLIDRKLIKQSRIRFAIQDILDMARNGWVARIEKESAKTIEEIHKAAERDKRQEERDRIKQDKRRQFDAKHVMRGPAGPAKNKTYHSNARRAPVSRRRDADGWESNATSLKGRRGRNQSQDVRAQETSSRQRGGWGKGPRSPPNKKGGRGGRVHGNGNDEKKKAKPRGNIFDMMNMLGAEEEDEEKEDEEKEPEPEPELTEEQRTKIVKAIKAFIEEYFMARDLSEAKLCVEELSTQILNHNIVFEGMLAAFERKEADREALRKMYDYFVTESVLRVSDITTGFNEMMEWANDILPDHPLLFKMLGKFLATFVVHAKAPISLAYLWSQPTEQLKENRSKFALGTFTAVKEAKDEKTLVSLVRATNKPLSDLGFTAEALTAGGFACLA